MSIIMRARRRAKCFVGFETWRPFSSRAGRRIKQRGKELRREGRITRAAYDVLEALIDKFHNRLRGWCFPSYQAIADAAGCARSTVGLALPALEAAGLLTWSHRIKRAWEACVDLFGNDGQRQRVVRSSNAYTLIDPDPQADAVVESSRSDFRSGTPIQDSFPLLLPSETALGSALARLQAAVAVHRRA